MQVHDIARCGSPSSRCSSKGGPATPSLIPGRAASFNHAQMYEDRRAGQPVWGRDPHAPVRVTLLRGQGCVSRHDLLKLAGAIKSSGAFSTFAGNGAGGSRLSRLIQHRRQGVLKRGSERLPSHFEFSRLNATNLDRGGHDEIHETPTFGTPDDR